MVDWLEMEIPYGMPMKRGFSRAWHNPRWNEKLVMKKDALYEITADLTPLGIPAQLSLNHRHHKRLGPKLKIHRVGDLSYSDWLATAGMVFEGDVEDASLMRVDLTADVPDVRVSDFAGALWCRRKLITRTEFGEKLSVEVQRQGSQTKYYGKKPRQFRIYNKTLHRLLVLLPEHNRKRRLAGLKPQTFMEVYGYDPKKIITRVERQMGNRETTDVWGIRHLGEIHKLAAVDPYAKFQFKIDCAHSREIETLRPMVKIVVGVLQGINKNEGLDAARSFMREHYDTGNSFRYAWNQIAHLIVEPHSLVTREHLTNQYRESISMQLAA